MVKNDMKHEWNAKEKRAPFIGILCEKVKVKVQLTLQQATRAQKWSRGVVVLFL